MLHIKQVQWTASLSHVIYKEEITSSSRFISFYIQTELFSYSGYHSTVIFLDCKVLCDLYGGFLDNSKNLLYLNKDAYRVVRYADYYDKDNEDYLIYNQHNKEFVSLLNYIHKAFIDGEDYYSNYHTTILNCITDLLLIAN